MEDAGVAQWALVISPGGALCLALGTTMEVNPACDRFTRGPIWGSAYTERTSVSPDGAIQASVLVRATDDSGNEVGAATQFNLETVSMTSDAIVRSSDGLAEICVPAGGLSVDGLVIIEPSHLGSALPASMRLLSGPYAIHGSDGLALTGTANLNIRYLDASRVSTSSARIHRWNGSAWVPLESSVGESHQVVSASITDLGTYALLANPVRLVQLPLVLGD